MFDVVLRRSSMARGELAVSSNVRVPAVYPSRLDVSEMIERLDSLEERMPAARRRCCLGETAACGACVLTAGPISDSMVSRDVINVMLDSLCFVFK